MRGPFWNNGKTGVTGEPAFRTATPNIHTYTDDQGVLRTVVLSPEAPVPNEEDLDQN